MSVQGLLVLGIVAGSSAFGGHRINTAWQNKVVGSNPRRDGTIARKMASLDAADVSAVVSQAETFFGDSSFVGVPGSLDSLPTELVASAAIGAAQSIVQDPRLESEIFTDFSHVAIDLMTFAAPAKAMLRLSVVLGRVAAIMADYIPDHSILPEEIVFQALMLGVSTSLFIKSFKPMISALLATTSYRDRRAYQALFRQYGLTWMQFKVLSAVAADWVEIAPGGVIERRDGDDFVYWLHKGEAELIVNDSIVQRVVERKPGKEESEQSCIGVLGELDLARKLQECKKHRKGSKPKKKTGGEARDYAPYPSSKIKVGPSGATLLRIDTTKLLKLMDDDEQLADSIRSIIFAGMQEKLSSMALEATPQNNTAGPAVATSNP